MLSDRLKQLAGQFLVRTREELLLLRAQVPPAQQGNREALLEMQRLAHRISGSGAMLGFKAISQSARQIENVLRRAELAPGAAEWLTIMEQLQAMDDELARAPASGEG